MEAGKQKKGIREISPIDVYRALPRTNCGECGEANCMAFATRVINGEVVLDACTPLFAPGQEEALATLQDLLAPPVRTVTFGRPGHHVTIGGKHVLSRHEFTYHNPPPIAIDIADHQSDEEIRSRIQAISQISYSYIGRTLSLDAIAVRATSGDPARFQEVIRLIREETTVPLVLCAPDPEIMAAGLAESGPDRPLIFAAGTENWKEMADLAIRYHCPLVASAPGNLSALRSLAHTLARYGVPDLVLDPGTFPDGGITGTILDRTLIRRAACREFDTLFGYPILGAPIAVWAGEELSPELNQWKEAYTASMLITRHTDLLIMHSLEGWVLLPQLIWRFGLYTDPRRPVSVDPGIRIFGEPGPDAPVFITSNYALTFFTVESDIKACRADCYLVVIDTGGLSVEAAVAGRYLTAEKIASSLAESGIGDQVSHRFVILPGLAARLSGETEEASGWRVIVGPRDSSGIGKMIQERWPVQEEG